MEKPVPVRALDDGMYHLMGFQGRTRCGRLADMFEPPYANENPGCPACGDTIFLQALTILKIPLDFLEKPYDG